MTDPEPLLFVDYKEPQRLELDILRQQSVRPNHDVNCALLHLLQHLLLLRLRPEAGEHLHQDGKLTQPLTENSKMLLRKHRCRNEHGRLLAVHDSLECGADGDFGFSVADITDYDAVHRPVGLHIPFHVDDRVHLIRRFAEGEGALHLFLPWTIRAEGIARDDLSLGVQLEKILGNVFNSLLGAGLYRLPVASPQAGHGRRNAGVSRPYVAAEPVGLVNRHVEFVSPGIVHLQVFPFNASQLESDQTFVDAYAVLHVDDIVIGVDIGKKQLRRYLRLGTALPLARLPGPTEQLGIGQEPQSLGPRTVVCRRGRLGTGHGKPFRQGALQERDALARGPVQVGDELGGQLGFPQLLFEPSALPRNEHDRIRRVSEFAHLLQDAFGLTGIVGAGHKVARKRGALAFDRGPRQTAGTKHKRPAGFNLR